MRQTQLPDRTIPLLAAAIIATSCIYDKPAGDEFYRTLWKSDETSTGITDVSSLTLEFLCNEGISITAATGSTGNGTADRRTIYGTYACDDMTATFKNLTLHLQSTDTSGPSGDNTITFIEAHRNGDTLLLIWCCEDNPQTRFTTTMHRLNDYGN